MHKLTIRVPGSLILFGEYFITCPNNRAVCLAPNIYATLTLDIIPATRNTLWLSSSLHKDRIMWDSPRSCPMYSHAYSLVKTFLPLLDLPLATLRNAPPHVSRSYAFLDNAKIHAHIDTRQLFNNSSDTKLGLGSSEVTAILCCVLVLVLHKIDPLENLNVLAQYSSATHHAWQQKRGSGYGIFTSIFGGVGLFCSLETSTWEKLHFPSVSYLYYLQGKNSIISKHAISTFNQWVSSFPTLAHNLQLRFQEHLDSYPFHTNCVNEIITWLEKAKTLGIEIGELIGISAHISTPSINEVSDRKIVWKATGAGNENAIGISNDKIQLTHESNRNIIALKIGEGITWV